MVMPKVKVCGITRKEDALAAVAAGCDALGFLFYKKSPRCISLAAARAIIKALPKRIITIGVFVNAPAGRVKRVAGACGLGILQFHGEESPAFCRLFKKYKIIKTFRIKEKIDFQQVARYDVWAYLFDTWAKGARGGTGKQFNWKVLATPASQALRRPVFLSGGLKCGNVRRALACAHPAWVDVSSGVESAPGKKDHGKVKRFIAAVKGKGGSR